MNKICIVASNPMTINVFLSDQITALSQKYKVDVVVNDPNLLRLGKTAENIQAMNMRIERNISLYNDLKALFGLVALFRSHKYDIVHSYTPKAGLLAMTAAAIAGVPIRVHTFTGQIWAHRTGIVRWFLKTLDKLIVSMSTSLLIDSQSQRDFLIREGVIKLEKASVLAKGSVSGVDTSRFCPNQGARYKTRVELDIHPDDLIILYLGRLKKDKGVLDLADAFSLIARKYDSVHLLSVGPDEDNLQSQMQSSCSTCQNRLHFIPYTHKPEQYMSTADIFCLPSYREGFGSVIIEAASVELPAIGSNIYGITDAIEHNVSGLLFEPGDIVGLVERITLLVDDSVLRKLMGKNARMRAIREFSKDRVTSAVIGFYDNLLKSA